MTSRGIFFKAGDTLQYICDQELVRLMVQPLDITQYRNAYEPEKVQCASTEEMQPMEEIIGQERALRALRFGLEIRESGFNVYTAGAQGTGRMTAVRSFLDEPREGQTPCKRLGLRP